MAIEGTIVLRRFATFDTWRDWTPVALAADVAGNAVVSCARRSQLDLVYADPATRSGLARLAWTIAVHRWEGARWERVLQSQVEVVDVHVALVSDGSVLVVGSHSVRTLDGDAERNAVRFAPDGTAVAHFCAGDGVLDVQATAGGACWIAYSDEGVMGDYGHRGWGRITPEEWVPPVGEAGLVRYAGADGLEPLPVADEETLAIAGCHALNVWGDEAWFTYHPGFPLVVIRGDRRRESWRTSIPAVIDAFAVDGERFLAHAGPRRGRHRTWLGTLGDDGAAPAHELCLRLDDDTPVERIRRVIGRGSVLHAFTDRAWYGADLRLL